jgi:hypothetical protein
MSKKPWWEQAPSLSRERRKAEHMAMEQRIKEEKAAIAEVNRLKALGLKIVVIDGVPAYFGPSGAAHEFRDDIQKRVSEYAAQTDAMPHPFNLYPAAIKDNQLYIADVPLVVDSPQAYLAAMQHANFRHETSLLLESCYGILSELKTPPAESPAAQADNPLDGENV